MRTIRIVLSVTIEDATSESWTDDEVAAAIADDLKDGSSFSEGDPECFQVIDAQPIDATTVA